MSEVPPTLRAAIKRKIAEHHPDKNVDGNIDVVRELTDLLQAYPTPEGTVEFHMEQTDLWRERCRKMARHVHDDVIFAGVYENTRQLLIEFSTHRVIAIGAYTRLLSTTREFKRLRLVCDAEKNHEIACFVAKSGYTTAPGRVLTALEHTVEAVADVIRN